MRIGINAHLCSPSSTYRNAGISRYIRQLLEALARCKGMDDIHIFASHDDFPAEYVVHPSKWNTENPKVRIAWEQMVLPSAIKRLKLDLLHSPMHVLPAVCPCKSVVSILDLTFRRFPETFPKFQQKYLDFGTRRAVKKADAVITISESTKRDVVELLGVAEDKVFVTHLGVDASYHPVADEQREYAASKYGVNEKTVMYLGTLEPRKNIPTLIRAFSAARKELGPDIRLVLSGGKGWFYEQIFQLIKELKIEDDVHFTGYVPDEDLPALYSSAAVFAYPSIYEGFGLPPLEAMACGAPVITSNTSSLPEVVGDAGITVDPYDVKELSSSIIRVLSDSDLRNSMREKGLKQAARFNWENTAKQTLEVYQKVLAGQL